ncbi:dehydrogenase/reductase SDR family member 9 isoform X1 [Gallus gallus]|uniref:dehydrogenase/reductase SDR family member 9 isoform X1 n=1 Tax=Gallus gallus TaxID=9031 RepID=UPI001AE2A4D2|nr:dehydrogenase/reductase SDR family member 9 isoform X1 [Gallus gallus]XP_040532688.1 dehydrogenase/reductase SDR family member 9 isoform X1 [Gallus gallus]XP_046777911.1 dehydrogenase/reductase SDR family member 9 isoform X1 [Gallus gallus]XP_046777912.1 dehydrogenase/reductase SDR family member 9 isoform X1 [Gallus gallus]
MPLMSTWRYMVSLQMSPQNLSFSDSLHIVILASILSLIIYWLIRDRHRVRNLSGKYIFITGCDTRLGNALARWLDKRGFFVIAACATEQEGQELRSCSSLSLKTVNLDLADSSSISRAIAFVTEETEGKGLFGLVNAAEGTTPAAPTDWLRIDDFHSELEVNLLGLIEITLKLLPLLKKAKGRVVNLINAKGFMAFVGGGYNLSKWGMESFSDILRRDIQHFGVKVSIVGHSFFNTEANSGIMERDLLRLWNRLPNEIRDSYGEKYFSEYRKAQRSSVKRLCNSDISKVIKCMEHALLAKYPRTRYAAGWDAKFFWLFLSYAPSYLSDTLFYMLFPAPAASGSTVPGVLINI